MPLTKTPAKKKSSKSPLGILVIVIAVVAGVLVIILLILGTLALELTDHFKTVSGSITETVTQNEETLPAS